MSKEITTQVNTLLDLGMTPEQIVEESGIHPYDIHIDMITSKAWFEKRNITRSEESFVQNARTHNVFLSWFEQKKAAIERATVTVTTEAPAKAAAEPLATEKQAGLIMRLIAQGKHLEGGYISGPTEYDEITKMTRRAASSYIDSLLGNY